MAAIFPGAEITETPAGDYRWRVTVTKMDFKLVIEQAFDDIDYDNFKNSVDDQELQDCYSSVWGTMYRLQHEDKQVDLTALDETFLDSGMGRASPYDWQEIDGPAVLD